jgi:hypothetical protein
MDQNTHLSKPKESKASAGVAGVGGGTLLVVLASSLPENSRVRLWLTLIAPFLSVALTVIWLRAQVEIVTYMKNRKMKILGERARGVLQEALKNPNTSSSSR